LSGLARLRDQSLTLLLLGIGWQFAAQLLQNPLLPTPLSVLTLMASLWQQGELMTHLLITLQRVLLSFSIAMLLGGMLGCLMGRLRSLNRWLDPVLVLLLNIPALVVIILLYVWFGLVEAAAVAAVVINKLPNVAVTLREGARTFDPELEEMAKAYGFSFRQKLMHLWWPQLFPYFMVATRSGLALIWKIVLVVELLGRSDGIGFQLHLAFQLFDVTRILAFSFAFIVVVQLIEWCILQPLDQYAMRWQREAGHV
jgi:ABC-type nitrate/sulfonate/bicarbonate transport system permease component